MTFDEIKQGALQLSDTSKIMMLFYLLGSLNGYYKFDLDQESKTLNKQQMLMFISDSLNAAK